MVARVVVGAAGEAPSRNGLSLLERRRSIESRRSRKRSAAKDLLSQSQKVTAECLTRPE